MVGDGPAVVDFVGRHTVGVALASEPIINEYKAGSRSKSRACSQHTNQVAPQKSISLAENPWGGVLFLSRSSPIHPTPHCSLEPDRSSVQESMCLYLTILYCTLKLFNRVDFFFYIPHTQKEN